MWKLVGLSHLSDSELYLLLLVAVCCALAVGWIMDLIMDHVGFGIFGNAGVALLGMYVGLYLYNTYYGKLTSPDIFMVLSFTIASVMVHLVVLSVLRRVLRL
jgi:uncharacterized membrane protein YeaQ/YmgE (transglycosylase-associated protein family)